MLVFLLLAIGLLFLLVELFFVPGTTVFGIVGAISTVAGIVASYLSYGATNGTYVLLGAFMASGTALYAGLQSKTWKRFALKDAMRGKVDSGRPAHGLSVGDEGVASSTLRPGGTAEFGGREVQVSSVSGVVDRGARVRVSRLDGPYVYVRAE